MKRKIVSYFFQSIILILIGCGGSGEGLDSAGNPVGSSSGSTSGVSCGSSGYVSTLKCDASKLPFEPTLTNIQAQIFSGGSIKNACVNCHATGGGSEGLVLDDGASYKNLVNVFSAKQTTLCRVAPGKPDDSYLIMKLEGATDISGSRMPVGGPYLTDDQICVVRAWIENNAPNN